MTAKKWKILMVEDVPVTRVVIERGLRASFDVVSRENGEEALRLIESESLPDVILLDVILPGMDGFEVCRKLKSSGKTSHIPVIFMTSLDDLESEDKAIEVGAADYVTKPVSIRALLLRIKTQMLLREYSNNKHIQL